MKNLSLSVLLLATIIAPNFAQAASADTQTARLSNAEMEPSDRDVRHPYNQLFGLQAAAYTPKSIQFTNWNNNSFNYNSSPARTSQFELNYGIQMTSFAGTSLFFSEGLSYSNFSFKLPDAMVAATGNSSVSMNFFGIDSRLTQAWESFPIASVIPFWEAGYRYTLYNQVGASDLAAGEGSAGNWVAGGGIRFWLNRAKSLSGEFPGRYVALPIFLTAKVNKIFTNGAGVDPAATMFMAGVSVGL